MATITDSLPDVQEFVQENSVRVVWALAWPAVALNSLQVVNTLLDRGFIGHLQTSALTAHGGATNVMFLMFSLAISIATGATALVSRAYGADDPAEYRNASKQSLALALAFGVVIGIITSLGAHTFSTFILPREDTEAIAQMTRFLVAYGVGLPGIAVIQTLAGALRGIGDTKSPMVISGVQILLHMTLNFILIFPPRVILGIHIPGGSMGLMGAATALSASATVSAIAYVVYIGQTPLGKLWPIGLPQWSYVSRIMNIAVPAGLQSVLRVLSFTTFTLILALVPHGSNAIAAMSIAIAIETIMILPAFGLAAASGALVGQSLGMKRPDRAERLGWIAGHHSALVTGIFAIPIFIKAPWLCGVLLLDKPEIVATATMLLRCLCVTEIFFSYAMAMIGAMQGAGDTVRPMWLAFICLWLLRLPLAFFLSIQAGHAIGLGLSAPVGLGMGATGAWIAMSATQAVYGILSIALFKQGNWKLKEV